MVSVSELVDREKNILKKYGVWNEDTLNVEPGIVKTQEQVNNILSDLRSRIEKNERIKIASNILNNIDKRSKY